MSAADRVRALVEAPLGGRGFELVDVEQHGSTLRVAVDRPGGIDLDALSQATEVVSEVLDRDDPLPGRYTLEVSSPGVERPLRTPADFRRVVGSTVSLTTRPGSDTERALRGALEAADDEGVVVAGARVLYGDIERARTVFEWGPTPRPSPSRRKPSRSRRNKARAR